MLITRVCTRIIFELLCEKIPQLKNNIDRNLIKDHLSVKIYSGDVFDYTLHKPRQISTPSDIPIRIQFVRNVHAHTLRPSVTRALAYSFSTNRRRRRRSERFNTHIQTPTQAFVPSARAVAICPPSEPKALYFRHRRKKCARGVLFQLFCAFYAPPKKSEHLDPCVTCRRPQKKNRKNSGEKSSHLCVQPARKTERKQGL